MKRQEKLIKPIRVHPDRKRKGIQFEFVQSFNAGNLKGYMKVIFNLLPHQRGRFSVFCSSCR